MKTYLHLLTYFSRRDNKGGDRDIFNEKPTRDEQTVAVADPVKAAGGLGTQAVIHTTKGDIVGSRPGPATFRLTHR